MATIKTRCYKCKNNKKYIFKKEIELSSSYIDKINDNSYIIDAIKSKYSNNDKLAIKIPSKERQEFLKKKNLCLKIYIIALNERIVEESSQFLILSIERFLLGKNVNFNDFFVKIEAKKSKEFHKKYEDEFKLTSSYYDYLIKNNYKELDLIRSKFRYRDQLSIDIVCDKNIGNFKLILRSPFQKPVQICKRLLNLLIISPYFLESHFKQVLKEFKLQSKYEKQNAKIEKEFSRSKKVLILKKHRSKEWYDRCYDWYTFVYNYKDKNKINQSKLQIKSKKKKFIKNKKSPLYL